MKVLHFYSLSLALAIGSALPAQSGIIKGKVTDALNNEPIPFANVLILGTDIGTTTDAEGDYEITGLEPKLYDVRASYLG